MPDANSPTVPAAPPPLGATVLSYASPAGVADGIWRDGDVLVIPNAVRPKAMSFGKGPKGFELPERCVKCDAAEGVKMYRRTLRWHHPGIYAVILANLIIYAIVAAIVSKTTIVEAGLCAKHRSKRRLGIGLGWLGALAGIAVIIFGTATFSDDTAIAFVIGGILLFLGSIVAGMLMSRIVWAKKIDLQWVRLAGIAPAYLDHFDAVPPA